MLDVRMATGFRARPRLDLQSADVVRVHVGGGVSVAVLANGYDTGFSTCWPRGSRLILDVFLEA